MKTTRHQMLRSSLRWGIVAGLFGNKMGMLNAGQMDTGDHAGSPALPGSPVDDWHAELTRRIAELEARGGGTLELADGVYEISKPLRLPLSVSLVMTPYAVIRAKPGFQGDAVVIKGGGKALKILFARRLDSRRRDRWKPPTLDRTESGEWRGADGNCGPGGAECAV